MAIKVAIAGYGNVGRAAALAVKKNEDMELTALLTRRDPASLKLEPELEGQVRCYRLEDAAALADSVDVCILCSGSATDLPVMGPQLARIFHTVDSFDTHAKIPEYFDAVDQAAKESGHLSLISCGWDPGMFSLARLYGEAILPAGENVTFWGKGVSQGHSDAIRRIPGVKRAIQYTVPVEKAVEAVRAGEHPHLTAGDRHTRECYVVAEAGADTVSIERQIKTMPNYFADYHTTVHFIDESTFLAEHTKMPHGGFVIRTGETASGDQSLIEYRLQLQSNPDFTGSILAAFARAVVRMANRGSRGACSVFDIPPALLSLKTPEQLRAELL